MILLYIFYCIFLRFTSPGLDDSSAFVDIVLGFQITIVVGVLAGRMETPWLLVFSSDSNIEELFFSGIFQMFCGSLRALW